MDAFDSFMEWLAEQAWSYFLLIAAIFMVGGAATFLFDKAFETESNEWWHEDGNGMRVSAKIAEWTPVGGAAFPKPGARSAAGTAATRGLRADAKSVTVRGESIRVARETDPHSGIEGEIAGQAIGAVLGAPGGDRTAHGSMVRQYPFAEGDAVPPTDGTDAEQVSLHRSNHEVAAEQRGEIDAAQTPDTKVFPGEAGATHASRMPPVIGPEDEMSDARPASLQAMSPYCLTRSGVSSPGKMRPVGTTCGVDRGTHVEYGRITFYARNSLGDVCVSRSGRSASGHELLPIGTPCRMDFGTHVEHGQIAQPASLQPMSPYCLTRSGVSSLGDLHPVGTACGVDRGTHVEYGRITFYARNSLGDVCVTRSGRSASGGELLPIGTPCRMDFGTHMEHGHIVH